MAYHNRQQRIGALITADATLNSAQIQQLKAAWESVSRGWSMGGTCILPGGLRPVDVSQMGANVSDTVTLQILQANDKSIARVYRVPTELLNLDPAVGRSAEEAGRWLTLTCLGPLMENIEQSLTKLFGLDDAYSWVETDYSYVHRTSELDRWAAIEASVRAGVRSVNEARKLEGLPQVAGGSTPLVQMQDLPIGLASELGAATIERVRRESARNNPQAAPTEPGAPPAANDPQPEKTLSPNQIRERVSDRIRLITRSAL
jgi:phage portal protein BeeE